MTVDVAALLAESAAQEGQRCFTCRWLESRPAPERDVWLEALDQPKTWPATQVARAMAKVPRENGAPSVPSAGSILNHRTGHQRELDGGAKRQKT